MILDIAHPRSSWRGQPGFRSNDGFTLIVDYYLWHKHASTSNRSFRPSTSSFCFANHWPACRLLSSTASLLLLLLSSSHTLVVRHSFTTALKWVRVGISLPLPPPPPILAPPLDDTVGGTVLPPPSVHPLLLAVGWLLCQLSNVLRYGWNSIYSGLLRNSRWMSWENWIFLKRFHPWLCLLLVVGCCCCRLLLLCCSSSTTTTDSSAFGHCWLYWWTTSLSESSFLEEFTLLGLLLNRLLLLASHPLLAGIKSSPHFSASSSVVGNTSIYL